MVVQGDRQIVTIIGLLVAKLAVGFGKWKSVCRLKQLAAGRSYMAA